MSDAARGKTDTDRVRETIASELQEAGLLDPLAAVSGWTQLIQCFSADHPFRRLWPEARTLLRAAADPDLAFATWSRWAEADAAPTPEAGERARVWEESAEFREGFITLAGVSPAVGELLLVFWRGFRPATWQSGWETKASLSRPLRQLVDQASPGDFPDIIRRFQRAELLRIVYLDCVQKMPVDRVTLQISSLADVLIAACYEHAMDQVSRRRGILPPGKGFAVLALGKLGGLELNYSSDIDLNFVYDETLERLEREGGEIVGDRHEIERFFTQVAERIIQLITVFTEVGQLYRLDTRLRPDGSAGRLAWSARASIEYYYATGRAWERQALIRLRPVAGDIELGARLQSELEPFIFPASFSPEEIAEIRGLKMQMEKLVEDQGASDSEVKIGRGGIRDVEYIVQYLQLIHASKFPALKKANTFLALELLEQEGLLKPEETDVLRRGYRFLRRVEHRLQLSNLRQTHRVPEDPLELRRLARGLGFPSGEAFRAELARHSTLIRRVYRLLFEEATVPRRGGEDFPALLQLPLELSAAAGAKFLTAFGFKDPEAAFLRLRSLASGREEGVTLDAQRSREVFGQIVLRLLREISLQPQPDQTLSNFEECVRCLGARSAFFQLLAESDSVLKLFVEICARSSMIVDRLRTYPEIFDEVVDALLTGHELNRESLIAQVERLCSRSSDVDRQLFKFKHLHTILIAIRDLKRLDNLSTTTLSLSELAEALLHTCSRRGLEEADARMGPWPGAAPRFLVLGLGKFAGQEMSYGSDLDLVFLYRGNEVTAQGITTQEYFERLSQAVLRLAASTDSFGPLLEIDLRLRPLGGHNSLAISLDAWKQYFQGGQARTWERQAFLRARPVSGDMELGREAMEYITREIVLGGRAGPRSRSEALADIRDMRQKLEAHSKEGDLKRGFGGIMDVEFLVQALQLCHGREHPQVLTPNTASALGKLLEVELLSEAEGSALLTSYQFLRWIENRVTLVGETGKPFAALGAQELESLIQKTGYKSSGEESALSIFLGELEYHRKMNRRALERVLELGP